MTNDLGLAPYSPVGLESERRDESGGAREQRGLQWYGPRMELGSADTRRGSAPAW